MTDELPLPEDGAVFQLPEYPIVVLLIDDQLMVVEAVRRALMGESDIAFHYCVDPQRAVAKACELKPTVILQDLIMPGIDGLDLVRQYRISPETRQIPIIVLSSQEESATKSRAFAEGADDYLVKIPDRIELIARIRHHSKAYINQLQRDAAHRALQESQHQLERVNLKLEHLIRTDALTGLWNRGYFNEYIDSEWKRMIRRQDPLSLLMIDVDNFKRYNDTYGHLAGDEVLIKVASTIKRSCARSTDFSARFGGEEFVVILSGTPNEGAQVVAARLCHAVVALDIAHSGSLATGSSTVSVSVGIATMVPQMDRGSPKQLIEAADRALFRAKADGRNRAYVAFPEDYAGI